MREKFNILKEDDQKMYNKWVKGIAKQDAPSQVITVDDVINRYRNTLDHNAPKQLPFGLDFLLNQIGDILTKTANIRVDLSRALRNPVIYQKKHRIDAVEKLNDKMDQIQKILFSTTEDMNNIVENPEKDDKL
jgi:hypothetical protein